jgi:hypothetical protein
MGINISILQKLPAGVAEGNELIAGLDECLTLGFARLGPAQHEVLEKTAGTFTGTPLHGPLTEAIEAVRRSEFLAKHFCALAAARAAIQGAQYDALFQQASEALGRKGPGAGAAPKPLSAEGQHTAWLSSTQQWLMELALAGFKHLSVEGLTPFMATLEQMQADPKLARLASLLTGFLMELLAAAGVAGGERPVFRWADLWTRAMIAAQQPPWLEGGTAVNGTLQPLGVDVRAHAHFVNLVIYGLLEAGKERRVVRMPLSSYKVDVIAPQELWQLFRPAADPLLESLAGHKALQISGMQLLASGDLLWTGKARLGAGFDLLASGAAASSPEVISLPPQPPLTRHPVQLAELVAFENISVRKSATPAALGRGDGNGTSLELAVDGGALPIATERLSAGSELDAKTLVTATAMVGLLRFDRGGWAVQPLAARAKAGKKECVIMIGGGALEFCKKDKLKTLSVLSERAGKLLRQQ